jgi:hypothetical protein
MTYEEFRNPPERYRPLQLILSYEQLFGDDEEALRRNLRRVKELGIRGLVVTVNQENYLRSEKAWDVLQCALRISKELGFRLWLYDEEGYPSGSAGGLVLKRDPTCEATGLIERVNGSGEAVHEVIPLYQDTHATENFYQKRRYINILDPKATATFIELTHEEYARRLGDVSRWFETVFTDEPSLINTYVPKGKTYPLTLPWVSSLPEVFFERKGYDLMPHVTSLYHDVGEKDRKIRCDFYEVVSELCAENYFGQIQRWCQQHGIASSGHLLGEETLVWQTSFEGDPFACYRKMDIPGIDMILSSPERIMNENFFIVPKLASSAAQLMGKREVMCEISDFLGESENRPATFEQITCTAGILYALGVTELVCMYGSPILEVLRKTSDQTSSKPIIRAEDYRRYTEFVARLKSVFSRGKRETRVAVLHPIVSVWANFTPSNRSMYEPHPNERVRFIDRAFTNLCRDLLHHQIDFALLDDKAVTESEVGGGELIVAGNRYSCFILPAMDTIRCSSAEKIAAFAENGGHVYSYSLRSDYAAEGVEYDERVRALVSKTFTHENSFAEAQSLDFLEAVTRRIKQTCELSSKDPPLLCTPLSLDGETIFFIVNPSPREWKGTGSFAAVGEPFLLHPLTAEIISPQAVERAGPGTTLSFSLNPYESLFIYFKTTSSFIP